MYYHYSNMSETTEYPSGVLVLRFSRPTLGPTSKRKASTPAHTTSMVVLDRTFESISKIHRLRYISMEKNN